MKRLLFVSLLAACGGSAAKPTGPVAPKAPAGPVVYTTAEQVIEAGIAAEGGRAKLATVTSLHTIGSINIPQLGAPGTFETFGTPPNNSLMRFEAKGLIKEEAGVTGDIAWEKNTMMGARILTGPERSMALVEATFHGDLEWKRLYPKAQLKGTVKFADVDCYQVELTTADGQAQTRYYAKDTLLPIGLEMVAVSPMGKVPVKVVNSDWRADGGMLSPHKITREEAGQPLTITIDKVEVNTPIPPATFELSDEIKQLAAATK